MSTDLNKVIIDLWHVSRIALSTMPTVPTRYDRMIYIKNELKKDEYKHLIVGKFQFSKHLWFLIEELTNQTY